MEHLIPEHWFIELATWALFLVSLVSMATLIKGADWLVEGASGIAYRMGMPKVIVGATIVSLGTTSPECAVSVMAAWGGDPGLALGNAVGSIIADTAMIFGIGALIVTLPADRFVLSRQGWVQFASAVLLAAMCYGVYFFSKDSGAPPTLGRGIGLALLALLVGYMVISIRWSKQHPGGEPFQVPEEAADAIPVTPESIAETKRQSIFQFIGMSVIGLTIVIFASHVLIEAVSQIALRFGIPQTVIAATLVAFGTSLPELVVGIMSIRKGHAELLVGNVIGADILNVLFVIGASAAAADLPVVEEVTRSDGAVETSKIFLYLHLPTMLATLVLFRFFIFKAVRKGAFSKWMGIPLIGIYLVYCVAQFVLST